MENKVRKVAISINIVVIVILFGSLIYGLIMRFTSLSDNVDTTNAQFTIVIAQCLTGLAVTSLPLIVEASGRKVPVIITISDSLFILLASVFGEVFEFYYKIWFWDVLLHFLCSILLSALWISIMTIFNKPVEGKYHFSPFFIALSVFCFIMAVGGVWEVIEFSVDSICGTNMQKLMVENVGIFNGGDSFSNLLGSDADIAALFRTPDGYKYALMDTMEDIVVDFAGALIISVTYFILFAKRIFNMGQFEYKPKQIKKEE